MEKPREWWIDLDADWMCGETHLTDGPEDGREVVHVVERAAYDKAIAVLQYYSLIHESAWHIVSAEPALDTLRELGEL